MKLDVSDSLKLPLEWMQLATVVYGARGSGKTSFARVMAEELHAHGQRFCAIDLKGDYYGLKSSGSGTEAGIPIVIFGGDHADVPLEPGSGTEVANIVASLDHSVVLDLEHLSKGKQVVFLAAFFERLYDVNRDPLLLILDEAQRYAPQKPMSPDATRCLGAVEDLVKLGRKHGIGVLAITQRGSSLNKEVSELCDMLVAFRTPGVLDQGRVKEWFDANGTKEERDEVMAGLSGLPNGFAWFVSAHPALKLFSGVDIRRPTTFDSSATPKIGQKRVEPKALAELDLDALRSRMSEAVERAKADDPKELRKKIVDLERQLAAQAPAEPQVRIEQVKVPVVLDEPVRQLGELLGEFRTCLADIEAIARDVETTIRNAKMAMPDITFSAEGLDVNSTPSTGWTVETGPVTRKPITAKGSEDFGGHTFFGEPLGKADRTILAAIQTHGAMDRAQLSLLTGYSQKTSTMSVALAALRKSGLIEPPDGSAIIRATVEGLSQPINGAEVLPPPGPGLIDYWLPRLGKAERSILEVMLDARPEVLTKKDVVERTGYSSQTSTLSVALARLRTMKLIEGWEVSRRLVGG